MKNRVFCEFHNKRVKRKTGVSECKGYVKAKKRAKKMVFRGF